MAETYRIELTTAAARELRKFDRALQRRLRTCIDALSTAPRGQGVIKLTGRDEFYRVRVGDVRIIYAIEDDRLLILIVRIARRDQAYER